LVQSVFVLQAFKVLVHVKFPNDAMAIMTTTMTTTPRKILVQLMYCNPNIDEGELNMTSAKTALLKIALMVVFGYPKS